MSMKLDGRAEKRESKMQRLIKAGSMMMAALSVGCMVERAYDPTDEIDLGQDVISDERIDSNEYRPVLGAENGAVHGEVGALTLDHSASLLSAYDDGYYLSVETVIQLEDRAAMTLLSVSDEAGDFGPGLDETFLLSEYSTSGMQVTMLGCVGQDVGVYDEYDMPSDETHVVVTEGVGENTMDVGVTARWYDRSADGVQLETYQEAQTSFTLMR